jgi:phosphoribosylaminoimidazole-succinocarboxamide synthase
VVNNRLSNNLMKMLAEKGVPTHFVWRIVRPRDAGEKGGDRAAGGHHPQRGRGQLTKRLGVPEGTVLKIPTIEFSYKNDEYHDPLINHYHALALGLATQEEIDTITKYAFQVNDILSQYLLGFNIRLIDFKLEFGRLPDGSIVLADEISPDTCRFWDATTGAPPG